MKSIGVYSISALLLASTLITMGMPAEARRFFAGGPNRSTVGFAHAGADGQTAGARAFGPNAGAGLRGGQYAGPNGYTLQSAGGFAYKRGTGAFRQSGWRGKAPNGASGFGSSSNKYNAQTKQGTRTSNEQVTAANGKDYGYNGTSNYTKGVGDNTVINTDNKGSYDVNWTKGSKPVVTPFN